MKTEITLVAAKEIPAGTELAAIIKDNMPPDLQMTVERRVVVERVWRNGQKLQITHTVKLAPGEEPMPYSGAQEGSGWVWAGYAK